MGAAINPFTPNTAGTVVITITAASVATALAKASQDQQVVVQVPASTAASFIAFGPSTVTVTATAGFPILPGVPYCFTVGVDVTHIAVIGTSGTLYASTGKGIRP